MVIYKLKNTYRNSLITWKRCVSSWPARSSLFGFWLCIMLFICATVKLNLAKMVRLFRSTISVRTVASSSKKVVPRFSEWPLIWAKIENRIKSSMPACIENIASFALYCAVLKNAMVLIDFHFLLLSCAK